MFNKWRTKLSSKQNVIQKKEEWDHHMHSHHADDERMMMDGWIKSNPLVPKKEEDDWPSAAPPLTDENGKDTFHEFDQTSCPSSFLQDDHVQQEPHYEVLFREVENDPTVSNFSRRRRILVDHYENDLNSAATFNLNYVDNNAMIRDNKRLNHEDDEITINYLSQKQRPQNLPNIKNMHLSHQLTNFEYNYDGWNTSSDEENNEPWMDDEDFAILPTTTKTMMSTVVERKTSVLDPSIRLWNANAKAMWTHDVFFSVFAFLDDIFDMIRLSRVCRESYKAFRDPYLWRNEIENRKIRTLGFKTEDIENNGIENLDVIYAYCKVLMDYKMTKLKSQAENEKQVYVHEQNKLKEEKKQALQQRQANGLVVTTIISLIIICFNLSRVFFFLIAYFLFGATVVGTLLFVNTQPKLKKQQIMLNIVIIVVSVVLSQFNELNFLFMIVGAIAFSYFFTFKFIVTSEHKIQSEFLVKQRKLYQDMSDIDQKYYKITKELQEVVKRIPSSLKEPKKKPLPPSDSVTNAQKRPSSKCNIQ
nr:unnamed protein product [Naegleria fowleri]